MNWVEVAQDDTEKVRACQVRGNATIVVIVEYMHPNYGYYSDAAVFVKFAHADDWICNCSRSGWNSKEQILEWVPEFAPLFELEKEAA